MGESLSKRFREWLAEWLGKKLGERFDEMLRLGKRLSERWHRGQADFPDQTLKLKGVAQW